MSRARSTPKVDADLRRILADAKVGAQPIEAVFTLRGAAERSPDDIEETANALIERVSEESGSKPEDFNVFRNLGSLAVRADRNFVEKMLEQREIASAVANRQS